MINNDYKYHIISEERDGDKGIFVTPGIDAPMKMTFLANGAGV